jgi:cysteine desulfurase
MKNNYTYLDYAATTPLDPRVFESMIPYMIDSTLQGNPSSMHAFGRLAKTGLDTARESIAQTLHVNSREIIFTGSGTESDNLAIFGITRAYKDKGRHVIISQIEHKAIVESVKLLEKEGFTISYAPVDRNGIVDVEKLISLIQPDTILVSIMYVNNEVGSIQPIRVIADALSKVRDGKELPLLHTDACQAASIISIDPNILGVDLMTLNSGKIYGPKGIGCLWLRHGVKIIPVIVGGDQESGLRSGTENISLAIGCAKALELAQFDYQNENNRLKEFHKVLKEGISENISGVHFNTPDQSFSPSILNVSFDSTEGESLLLDLDHRGVYCSTGSACAATDLKPSYVLLSMGISEELAHASLRFSFGRFTTIDDIQRVIEVLPLSVNRIRSICPQNNNLKI